MKLKIAKPTVNSTISHYKPYQAERITPTKKASVSSIVELRECKRLMDKLNRQDDR
jgi:hypothetical protein